MITPTSNLALIAVGQPESPIPISNEIAWTQKRALDAGNTAGDDMAGPLTTPGLILNGVQVLVNNLLYSGVDGGIVNALVLNNSKIPTPFEGMILALKIAVTNTGATTLALNGGAAVPCVSYNGHALGAGKLTGANYILFQYQAAPTAEWQILNESEVVYGLQVGAEPVGTPTFNSGAKWPFPSGTRMLFQQATVPPTWTQDTALQNDSLLRIVSGAGGATYAGSGVSTVLRGGASVDGTAINISQMAPHYHGVNDPGHSHQEGSSGAGGGGTQGVYSESLSAGMGFMGPYTTSVNPTSISIQYAGGGVAHSHTLSALNVNSLDCIVGVKN